MAKITAGVKLPDFTYNTPYKSGINIAETVKKCKKTAIVFLRYYGCPICQYDIHSFRENYYMIENVDGQMLVVLQSDREKLAKSLNKNDLPFVIICDPDMELYRMFEIGKASSMVKMMDFSTVGKVAKATFKGMKHGEYEGEELQLPALFVVDNEMNVTFAHYGKAAGDVPDIEKIADLLK
ncbi:MAG: redoxin domain-containing protein [Clostridia bacterium]|nr:redoxin domain-containing protein [Clostridia bacterium]